MVFHSKSKDVLEEMKERIKSDVKRYRKYYRINNLYGIKNYDIIIDTSYLTVSEMNRAVYEAVKAYKNR